MAYFETATWKTWLQTMRSGICSLVNRKIILRYTNVRVKTPRNFNFGVVQKTRRKRDMYDVTCDVVMWRVSSSFRFLRHSWSKFSSVSVLLENRARTEVTVKSKSVTDRRQIHTNRCFLFFFYGSCKYPFLKTKNNNKAPHPQRHTRLSHAVLCSHSSNFKWQCRVPSIINCA